MNRREFFILSLTVFFTVLAWVIYDLLQVKYKELSKQNFDAILQTKPSFSQKTIEVLKQKQP